MVGFGLKFLCEELGVLEVVGDKEMGLKNRDFDELLRLDRVGFVFDQNDYLGKFEKQ